MKHHPRNTLNDQLSDPVPPSNGNGALAVEVDQRHLYLATVPSVDRTGSVGDREPFPDGQAAAWVNERCVAIWQRNSQSRRNQNPLGRRNLNVNG